jgi:hypothetical protein
MEGGTAAAPMSFMRRRPVESDFKVEVFKGSVAVQFWPTRSLYTFARFTTERDMRSSAWCRLIHSNNTSRALVSAATMQVSFGRWPRLATAAARAGKSARAIFIHARPGHSLKRALRSPDRPLPHRALD